MPRAFSLAHLTVLGCPPPETTYIAARAGYEFVSLRTIPLGLPGEPDYALERNPQLLRETKRALSETGVRLHDIELARIGEGFVPSRCKAALEIGAELGARSLLTSIWTDDRAFAVGAFAELCDLARPLGMNVDLEFVTFASVTNLKEAAEVLRVADRPNAGIMVDTLHFDRSRVAPAELDAIPRSWFHFVHLCDAPAEIPGTREGLVHTARDARLYCGEGGIDLQAILERIPEVPCSIELPHLERTRELGNAEHATRCLETAKRWFAEHPRSARA